MIDFCLGNGYLEPVNRISRPIFMNEADGDDAGNWKWGVFYYNPKDKKILVPKRYGMGWTLNLGHVVSFIIMGLF